MPEGLDWYVEEGAGGENLHPRPPEYRAPTWLWASVDSKVAFWSEVRIKYNWVVGWNSTEYDPNRTGPRYPLGIHWWTKKIKATAQPLSPELPLGRVKDASIVI